MTVFDPHPLNGQALADDGDEVLVKLRRWVASADNTADELATRGGQERKTAEEHMQAAARYDEQAVAARAKADELREVIAIVEERRRLAAGEVADHGPLAGAS